MDRIPELAEGQSDTCKQRLNCCWPWEGKKGHSCNFLVEVGHCSSVKKSVGSKAVRKHSDGKYNYGKAKTLKPVYVRT